jgi:hypothetical protein
VKVGEIENRVASQQMCNAEGGEVSSGYMVNE